MTYFLEGHHGFPTLPPEPDMSPNVESWVMEQKTLCDLAGKRLQTEREKRLKRANKGRKEPIYRVGDYVLIHKKKIPTMAYVQTKPTMVWAIPDYQDSSSNGDGTGKSQFGR